MSGLGSGAKTEVATFISKIETLEGSATLTIADFFPPVSTGKITSAIDARNGDVIHVRSLEVDKRREYLICPDCRDQVHRVMREGAWHFRHPKRTEEEAAKCSTGEGLLHHAAKHIFKPGFQFSLPPLNREKQAHNPAHRPGSDDPKMRVDMFQVSITWDWSTESWTNREIPPQLQKIVTARIEVLSEGFRPDVIVECEATDGKLREFVIEVCVSNRVDAKKKKIIKKLGYEAIEVYISKRDLATYLGKDYAEFIQEHGEEEASRALEKFVLVDAEREWLNSRIDEAGDAEVDRWIKREKKSREEYLRKIVEREEAELRAARRKEARKFIDLHLHGSDELDWAKETPDDSVGPFMCILRDACVPSLPTEGHQRLLNCLVDLFDAHLLRCLHRDGKLCSAGVIAQSLVEDCVAKEASILPDGWDWQHVDDHLQDGELLDASRELTALVDLRLTLLQGNAEPPVEKEVLNGLPRWKITEQAQQEVILLRDADPMAVLRALPSGCDGYLHGKKIGWTEYALSNDDLRATIKSTAEKIIPIISKREKNIDDISTLLQEACSIIRRDDGIDLVVDKKNSINAEFSDRCTKLEDCLRVHLSTIDEMVDKSLCRSLLPSFCVGDLPREWPTSHSDRESYMADLADAIERGVQQIEILEVIEASAKALEDAASELEGHSMVLEGIDVQMHVGVAPRLQGMSKAELLDGEAIRKRVDELLDNLSGALKIAATLKYLCESRPNPAQILKASMSSSRDLMHAIERLADYRGYPTQVSLDVELVHRSDLKKYHGIDIDAWLKAHGDQDEHSSFLAHPMN